MNALVLSAGGMYGAYQAGAWKVLSEIYRPDIVVGASIGAVNGWAIAAGCSGEELSRRWLNLEAAGVVRWKFPRTPLRGVLDSTLLQESIQEIHGAYRHQIEYAAVLTDLLTLQPKIFRGRDMRWQHLVASTAIIGVFDQMRIDGRVYSDGGLLEAVPLWAAAQLGATRALVINIMPHGPGSVARALVLSLRRMSRFRPVVPDSLDTFTLATDGLLGPPSTILVWTRENAEKWIEAGERDAMRMRAPIMHWLKQGS